VQYLEGSVDVTYNSQTVVGHNTEWLAYVEEGDWFKLLYSNTHYQIGSVDGNTQLTLTTPYGESTATYQSYVIVRDFTANFSLPLIEQGDRDWTYLLKKALDTLDEGKMLKVKDIGPDSSKPATPFPGQMYLATDTLRLYVAATTIWHYTQLT